METKKIQILGGFPQGNWEQNDNTKPDYIKNRPFYDDRHTEVIQVLVENVTFNDWQGTTGPVCPLVLGKSYDVIWCGEVYTDLVCYQYNTDTLAIGGESSDTPFIVLSGIDESDMSVGAVGGSTDWTISVIEAVRRGDLHKLDPKYLPEIQFPEQVISDWGENDPESLAYIKNRTHYAYMGYDTEIVNGSTNRAPNASGDSSATTYYPLSVNSTLENSMLSEDMYLSLSSAPSNGGEVTRITEGKVSYYSNIYNDNVYEYYVIGNQYYLNGLTRPNLKANFGTHEDTGMSAVAIVEMCKTSSGDISSGYPKAYIIYDKNRIDTGLSTKFIIHVGIEKAIPLDEKFIPDTIARTDDIPTVYTQPDEPTDAPDGTLWVDTDEEIGEALTLDTTLSIEGMAADAKAVGDALSGKLNTASLATAINEALAEAKESGEFDGEDGDGAGYPLAEPATELEPARYYVFGEVSELNVTLILPDDGYAREHCFEFIPTEDFAGLTVTPAPRWVVEPQFVAGEICQVSILRGVGVITSA